MCRGGNRSEELWVAPENLAAALLLCCWFISTLIHPSICHPFSRVPSSTLRCFFPPLFLSWIGERRSLLALTERGWRCLFIWRVLEPWLRRGGSSEADATSALLVRGPPAGLGPTRQENKKSRRMKKNFWIWSSRERKEVYVLAVSPALSFSVSLAVLIAELIINECGFCWTLERCQRCSHWGLRNLDI